METSTLLGQYANLLNLHDGPDSAEAKKFFEDNKDNKEFRELAETAGRLWQRLNRRK